MTQSDRDSQFEFIRENLEWAHQVAHDLVRDHADADDLTQTLWMEVMTKRPGRIHSPRAWIRGALRNLKLEKLRAQRNRSKYETSAAEVAPQSFTPRDVTESAELVQWALARLKSPYREVLELSYVEGLDNGEIARRLNVAPDTVRIQVSRALSKMRDVLQTKEADRGTSWATLLLPLLSMKRSNSGRIVGSGRRSRLLLWSALPVVPIDKRLIAGVVVLAALILFLRPLTIPDKSPHQSPGRPEGDGTVPQATAEKSRDPSIAGREVVGSLPNPEPTKTQNVDTAASAGLNVSLVVRVLDGGVEIDDGVHVELGHFLANSIALAARRPLDIPRHDLLPFTPFVSSRGRTGQGISIDVPKDETYLARIKCDQARNAEFIVQLAQSVRECEFKIVRKLRLRIPGISFDTRVAVMTDVTDPRGRIVMDAPDDDDDDVRVLKGNFLLPLRIEVAFPAIGMTAWTQLNSNDAVLAPPSLAIVSCRVRSMTEDRAVGVAKARSTVAARDGSIWTFDSSADSAGSLGIVTPGLFGTPLLHSATVRAEGYHASQINAPARTLFLRRQHENIDSTAPLDVLLAPIGHFGGGRILNADGNAVERGAVFVLDDENPSFVGSVNKSGRFVLAPGNTWIAAENAQFGLVAAPRRTTGTFSLLFDDDESSMTHFADVPADELARGEWIGRLPRNPGTRIRFIDRSTRSEVKPDMVVVRPMSKEGKILGKSIMVGFTAPRIPRGGRWHINAQTLQHQNLVTIIEAEGDSIEIELTPESRKPTQITLIENGKPVRNQAVEFLNADGSAMLSSNSVTDAEGRSQVCLDERDKFVRFRIKSTSLRPSVASPTIIASGASPTIELFRTMAVPVRAIDRSGRAVDQVAVIACDPSGRSNHYEVLVPENGYLALTREPQSLIVMGAAHRPQRVTWSPPESGPPSPVLATLDEGCRLAMRIEKKDPTVDIIGSLGFFEPYVDGVSGILGAPEWSYLPHRDLADEGDSSFFIVAPGRYRLEFRVRDKITWQKDLEIRSDIDLGTIDAQR